MTEQFSAEIDWNAIESKWRLEPELRHPAPRRVTVRGEKIGCGGRVFGCFLGAMMAFMFVVGLLMSVWAGLALLILPFGSKVEGVVTRHEVTISSGRRKGTESYFLHFRFARQGQIYTGDWPVSASTYLKVRDGDAVKVRYFPFAPGLRPFIEEGASPWFHVWALGPLGLVMLGVSGLILASFWNPKSGKALVRRGVATAGIIVSRTVAEGKRGAQITYLFRAQGQTWEKKRFLSPIARVSTEVGAIFTVLHHPRRPKCALIYQLCDFRALD